MGPDYPYFSTLLASAVSKLAELRPPDDLPEKILATYLVTLGLPWAEACAIASRPLPAVDLPVNPLSVGNRPDW